MSENNLSIANSDGGTLTGGSFSARNALQRMRALAGGDPALEKKIKNLAADYDDMNSLLEFSHLITEAHGQESAEATEVNALVDDWIMFAPASAEEEARAA